MHHHEFFEGNQGGYAVGSGSSVGTQNHQRLVYTSFDRSSSAEAVVVVVDHSSNGRRWRLNSPEFNRLATNPEAYTLLAPNGTSMRVQFVHGDDPTRLESNRLPYGGETVRHNHGIWYQNESYTHSRYIDYYCQDSVVAVITLQPAGKEHPKAVMEKAGRSIRIADLQITLPARPEE